MATARQAASGRNRREAHKMRAYDFPLDPMMLGRIELLLQRQDPITPSFIPRSNAEVYRALTYRVEAAERSTKTVLLADRNLVTRWIGVVRGDALTPHHRTAAAVIVFAQCAAIEIEPNIALYEAAARAGSAAANEELAALRLADDLDSAAWASIACGETHAVHQLVQPANSRSNESAVDFKVPLRRWRRNYVLALKAAELQLHGGKSAVLMARLLRWMHDEFLIGGPAVALAAHYFAPNANRKGLLKGLYSDDRKRALDGVRNAAWDLTLVGEWLARVGGQEARNELTLLASLDRHVHAIARLVTNASPDAESNVTGSDGVFVQLWGYRDGAKLGRMLDDLRAGADDPSRQVHRPVDPQFIDRLIEEGEERVRSWSGTRRA